MNEDFRHYCLGKRDAFRSAAQWVSEDCEGVKAEKLVRFILALADDEDRKAGEQ